MRREEAALRAWNTEFRAGDRLGRGAVHARGACARLGFTVSDDTCAVWYKTQHASGESACQTNRPGRERLAGH
jgi:hypothetical protein